MLCCLGSLTCIVFDDASRDPDTIAAALARHGAILLSLEHNVGPAAVRDIGFVQVRTPQVAFVDSEMQVQTTELLGLARHFANIAAIPPPA